MLLQSLALVAGYTVLSPGDVAIIGFNAQTVPDLVCMWVLTEVEAGTDISIAGIGSQSWTATYIADGDIGAGEVICLNENGQTLTTAGEVIGAPLTRKRATRGAGASRGRAHTSGRRPPRRSAGGARF